MFLPDKSIFNGAFLFKLHLEAASSMAITGTNLGLGELCGFSKKSAIIE
jgi:hypothetical protein